MFIQTHLRFWRSYTFTFIRIVPALNNDVGQGNGIFDQESLPTLRKLNNLAFLLPSRGTSNKERMALVIPSFDGTYIGNYLNSSLSVIIVNATDWTF